MKTKTPYELKLMMAYHVSIILAMMAEISNFKYLVIYTVSIGILFFALLGIMTYNVVSALNLTTVENDGEK